MPLTLLSTNATFNGHIKKFKLSPSTALGGLDTQFNIFLPKEAEVEGKKVPVLFYLAGLTCTEDTGPWKAGFLRDAAAHGLAMIFPDTSPRGANIPNEDDSWDFGSGAGFYLNASHPKWSKHYNMKDYITLELPQVISSHGSADHLDKIDWDRKGIMGHSMGGHGALTLYLTSLPPLKTYSPSSAHSTTLSPPSSKPFLSCSAYAPITNPTLAPWGKKAFGGPDGNGEGYLKDGLGEEGKLWDATEMIKSLGSAASSSSLVGGLKILADVGTGDNFYQAGQLLPRNFESVVREGGFDKDGGKVEIRLREGYDHSYYFISTFGPSHLEFHAKILKGN